MEHLPVALNAVKLGTQHFDKVKNQAEREIGMRKKKDEDPDCADNRTMEEKGYILRRRSQVQSDEEVVEVVRHKGQVLPRRPRNRRRTSSMEDTSSRQSRYQKDAGGYGSDSEGSVAPRGRRTRAKSAVNRGRSSSSSSSSSSQLGSSTDEEHEMKKMSRKKWLAAGFATIATIHAGSKVYANIQSHDKRVIALAKGEISPEEAHQQARKSRWQDAAAIGLAALGVKGAISEWKEMAEEHEKHRELCEQHEQMHKRRLEHQRKKKAKESGGYYKGRDGQWYYDGPQPQDSERRRSRGDRARSNSTWDTYDQVQGSRGKIEGYGDRKMIEAPPSRARSRSVYDRDRSRARSSYGGRDRDSDSRSPVRAKSRRDSAERRVSAYLDDR